MPTRYITKNLNQTAVYWAPGTPDGWGGFTWGTPSEIDCRWLDKQELFIDNEGKEQLSYAVVLADQDVALGGYLYLGDEDNLDSDHDDPTTTSDTREIRSFRKVPNLKATAFVRKAWL